MCTGDFGDFFDARRASLFERPALLCMYNFSYHMSLFRLHIPTPSYSDPIIFRTIIFRPIIYYLKNCTFLNILRFALFFALFWHPNPPHLKISRFVLFFVIFPIFFRTFVKKSGNSQKKIWYPRIFFLEFLWKKSETEKFFWLPPKNFWGTPRKFSGYPQIFFRIFLQKKSL